METTKLFTVLGFIGFSEARHTTKHGAARRRIDAAERAYAIATLGFKPEPKGAGPYHPDAYIASTGELVAWALQS